MANFAGTCTSDNKGLLLLLLLSVAAFTSRDEKWVGEGREEDTTEERCEGERERRFRLKVTGKGVGGTRVAKCNVNLMKKCSEICSGCTRMLSAVQSHV